MRQQAKCAPANWVLDRHRVLQTATEERLGARSLQLPTNLPPPYTGGNFTQTGPYLDPSRQMLGAEQEAWLFDKLRTTPARWKLLGQGVMFMQAKVSGATTNAAGGGIFFNSDAWNGNQPARDRVFDIIKGAGGEAPLNNVVVLTGDIHSSWAGHLTQDTHNPNGAAGGYDQATGAGSLAVEFVGPSVSSPGVDNAAQAAATTANFLAQNPTSNTTTSTSAATCCWT